jgi:phospholipid/cholesterol/gamma-HCH transport system substrate-binding protein
MLLERNQALIGFIAVAVIAAGTIFALAMTRGMFDRGHEVTAVFSDAAGLTVDDNVLAAGIRVGRVTSVEIVNGAAEVEFVFEGDLPADTRARIAVQNLLGRRQLHLVAGSNWDDLLRSGDVIPVDQTRTPIDVPEFGEEGEHLYREQDQDALQAIVTALADISEDKHEEVGDLIDGLTRVADTVSDHREDLNDAIDGTQRFFAAFRDRDEEIVRIVDSFGETLDMLVDRRSEVERLLQNAESASTQFADLVEAERSRLDVLLPNLHEGLQTIDENLVDIAHFFAYAPQAMSGWQRVGYERDDGEFVGDTPYWFNMAVNQAGVANFDTIVGCGGHLDEALDELLGPDPRSCREQDAAPDPREMFNQESGPGPEASSEPGAMGSSFAGFFRLETAAPVKFAPIIRSALGREPQRPAELADLEKRPQRFQVVANDAAALKRYIETAP